jgi:nitronate monooxygenase
MTSRFASSRLNPLLGIRHPLVQGPFGGNLSTVGMVASVSNAGGLGSFGAHMLSPDEIGPLVANIRKSTSAPFAINLWVDDEEPGGLHPTPEDFERWWPLFEPYYGELGIPKPDCPAQTGQHFADQVDALIEARPPVFSFVFGIPSRKVLDACRARGIHTVGAATTLAEAEALDAAGVDAIVVTGMEAGGHRPSFLASAETSLTGTFALIQLVAPRVKAAVIAAGGIADRRGVDAALMLGADGAQLGTAFLACEESGATPEHRAALWSPAARRTTLTRCFTGRLARGMENRWTRELGLLQNLAPYPLQSWFMSGLRRATAGRTDLVSLWSGQIAPNLRQRTTAALMTSLTNADSV